MAIISAVNSVVTAGQRVLSYNIQDISSDIIKLDNNFILNFHNLNFPLKIQDVSKFEILNKNISVNVFGLEGDTIIGPYYCTKLEKERHINLLLLQEGDKSHYVWIKNISRLLRSQITRNNHKMFICNSCLINFTSKDKLDLHKNVCNKVITLMPSPSPLKPDADKLKFTQIQRGVKVPFVIYADFECILQNVSTCLPSTSVSSTTNIQQHVPCAFSYYICCEYDNSLNKLRVYKGKDSPVNFIKYLVSDVREIYNNVYKNPKPMNSLTEEEKHIQATSVECHICKKDLGDDRVADHCHMTGIYRGPAHNQCNLLYRVPKYFPILLHNFSGYDCHLIVKALDQIEGEIRLIPLNKELYVSLSKWISSDDGESIELRFLDSFRFMPSSLETLSQNLSPLDFINIKSIYPKPNQFELVIRKGVFPYEYLNSWERLDDKCLPSQSSFYSNLTNTYCSDSDYNHAIKVWEEFKCENLWDYLKIYLITDVLILSDIFEKFRKVCYKIHTLDPCQYYTIPGLSWDAMLKYTEIELDLFTDIDMYNFIKNGIRGGITQCSHRHSLANNKYMEDYDETKESKYLMYFDINNLYGWAMAQPLPYGSFEWVENVENLNIMDISENSEIGYIFEVDLEYSRNLHDEHNDLPFCVENKCSPLCKLPKLIPNLSNKKNYIIHYRNLQQCLKFGLRLVKIHRAIQFKQACWLKNILI